MTTTGKSRSFMVTTNHLENHRSGPSPSTSASSQQEVLAAVREFIWNANTQITEGEETTSQEARRRRSHSTTLTVTTPQYSPVEDSATNQPLLTQQEALSIEHNLNMPHNGLHTFMKSENAHVNNVGMVSPSVV